MRTVITILVTAVFAVSLTANAWLVNERLQVKFYQKGLSDASRQLTDRIVQEVQKTGQLKVTFPNGQGVVLAAQRTQPVDPNTEGGNK